MPLRPQACPVPWAPTPFRRPENAGLPENSFGSPSAMLRAQQEPPPCPEPEQGMRQAHGEVRDGVPVVRPEGWE